MAEEQGTVREKAGRRSAKDLKAGGGQRLQGPLLEPWVATRRLGFSHPTHQQRAPPTC